MPAKGSKLTSAQRASRARKAAITRCQNKCVKSGGARRKMSSAARKAASSRARKNPWLKHVAEYRAAHPSASYKDALIGAKKSYHKA